MSTPTILPLEDHRRRKERRLDRTIALNRGDPARSALVDHLRALLQVTGGERAAAVWIDEYEGTRPHAYAILDLAADPPRRDVDIDLLVRCWEAGVPAVVPGPAGEAAADAAPRRWAVSLGSDGIRIWFIVVEAGTSAPRLASSACEEMMFLAGECAAVLLHRDLDSPCDPAWLEASVAARDDRYPEASPGPVAAARRAAADLARCLLQYGLDTDSDSTSGPLRALAVRGMEGTAEPLEGPALVVEAAGRGDVAGLASGLLRTARDAEEGGAYLESADLYGLAYEMACVGGTVREGGLSARGKARALRRVARWDDAVRWYEVARGIAQSLEDEAGEALALDGIASVYVGRGRIPAARTVLHEAQKVAHRSGDADALASVHFSLMTVAHTEGRLAEAATHGWEAFRGFRGREGKLRSLTALGGVFLDAGSLDSAEDAFAIVERDSRDRYYRLYALAGLARVEAARGDLGRFENANRRLDEAGFEDGSPEFRAEAMLERGDGYRELGVLAEARRWYLEAVAFSEKHGVSEYLIRAERALGSLDVPNPGLSSDVRSGSEMEDGATVRVIRRDLGALRRGVVGAEA